MSWESSSSATTDSTSDASCASVTTGYFSIPQTDSSVDGSYQGTVDRSERLRQNYRGQLRIDVNVIGNYICIHLIAAKNILTKSKSKPDCFVEVTILPESRVHPKCISTIYYHSKGPVFDEKISMELPINFEAKRLLITLIHIKTPTGHHEFLGSMSFGLHRARSEPQVASGWYYILDEGVGSRRHVKVIDNAVAIKSFPSNINVSKVLLCRTEDGGFGFSVIGSRPVRITRVRKGSTAELHNLENQIILAIDVYDVRNSTAVEVAAIIRNVKFYASMAIQRSPDQSYNKSEDKVKNGIVSKLIKKIFYGDQRINATGSNTASDKLVNYGWLEREGSENRDDGARGTSSDPQNNHHHHYHAAASSLTRSNSLRNSLRRQESQSRHASGNHRNSFRGDHASTSHHDDVRSRSSVTSNRRWHSLKGRISEEEEEEEEAEEKNVSMQGAANYGRTNVMLSPVAEDDSRLQSSCSVFDDENDDGGIDDDSKNSSNVVRRNNVAMGPYRNGYHADRGNDSQLSCDDVNDRRELPSLGEDEDYEIVDEDDYAGEGNIALGPGEFSETSISYLQENDPDDDYKENQPLPRHHSNQSQRATSSQPFRRLSFRENIPLSSKENFTPLSNARLQNRISSGSLKIHDRSGSRFDHSSIASSSSQRRNHKAVVSKMKMVFMNKHVS